jgi:hypothetical protein
MGVIIDIDHEAGNTSEYSSLTDPGGKITVTSGAALAGSNYGLAVAMDGSSGYYARAVITANTTGVLRGRFYIDPNSLTIPSSDQFTLVTLYNNSGQSLVMVNLLWNSSNGFRMRAGMVDDSGGNNFTAQNTITDAPHYVEFKLVRASGSASSDGSLEFYIDGVLKETVSGIDNYDRFANFAELRVGAVSGVDAGTSGTFYLDEFIVNDDGSVIGERSSSITGSFSLTGSAGSVSGDADVRVSGSATLTGSAGSVSGSGSVLVSGSAALSGSAGSLAGSGSVLVSGW